MFGVVLAAHGEVAPALLKAAEQIVGPLDRVRALSLEAGSDPKRMESQLREAVDTVDEGDGVLVLCDMFGGTPSNICLATRCACRIEVVTGLNLPMLLKVSSSRGQGGTVEAAATELAEYGRRHITHASAMLRDRAACDTGTPAGSAPR